jgi:hypothetical protein
MEFHSTGHVRSVPVCVHDDDDDDDDEHCESQHRFWRFKMAVFWVQHSEVL